MKKCHDSRNSRLLVFLILLVYPLTAVGLVVCAVVLISVERKLFFIILASLCMIGAVLAVWYMLQCYCFEKCKYVFLDNGISFKTCFRKPVYKGYDEIVQVCFLIYAGTASLNDYRIGICFHFSSKNSNKVSVKSEGGLKWPSGYGRIE